MKNNIGFLENFVNSFASFIFSRRKSLLFIFGVLTIALGFSSSNIKSDKLYKRICELLKNRSISRALGSKWLLTLIEDRENTITNLSID